jgi:hypothetical protein
MAKTKTEKVAAYVDINIGSVEKYWSELVVTNVKEFQNEPSPRTLFNVAGSVWHLIDWVWHDRNPGKDGRGSSFKSYRNGLLARCPDLALFRDIADAGKHCGLGRDDVEVESTEPTAAPGGNALLLGDDARGFLSFLLKSNDGSKRAVNEVLRRAINFWLVELKAKNLPSPYA